MQEIRYPIDSQDKRLEVDWHGGVLDVDRVYLFRSNIFKFYFITALVKLSTDGQIVYRNESMANFSMILSTLAPSSM